MILTHFISKSCAAFLFSTEVLAAMSPRLYFWTFTWAETDLPLPDYRRSWNRFTTALQRRTREGFAGLRVWEYHPGGHGLHVHLLCNERLDVRVVRILANRAGLGRIHVRQAAKTDAEYLAKYMTKRGRIHGVKQWSKVGRWRHVKVGDIEIDSAEGRFLKKLYHSPDVQALPPNRRWLETQRLFRLLCPKLLADRMPSP